MTAKYFSTIKWDGLNWQAAKYDRRGLLVDMRYVGVDRDEFDAAVRDLEAAWSDAPLAEEVDCNVCGASLVREDGRWFHERIEDGSHDPEPELRYA